MASRMETGTDGGKLLQCVNCEAHTTGELRTTAYKPGNRGWSVKVTIFLLLLTVY